LKRRNPVARAMLEVRTAKQVVESKKAYNRNKWKKHRVQAQEWKRRLD
tara:strand:- start:238 stop:381 length:144 start_codon:yes stop_codon:yes gene_type:complete